MNKDVNNINESKECIKQLAVILVNRYIDERMVKNG